MKSPAPFSCCQPDQLPSPRFFRALGDPNRILILAELASCCGGSKTVREVAAGLPTDVSVVSRHLATLRDAGVLASKRRGKEVHYTVCYGELVKMLRDCADAIEACCPPSECSSTAEDGTCRITQSESEGKENRS